MLPNFDWVRLAQEINVPVEYLAAYFQPYEEGDDYELDIQLDSLVGPQWDDWQ